MRKLRKNLRTRIEMFEMFLIFCMQKLIKLFLLFCMCLKALIGTATARLLKRLTKISLMFGAATVLIIISCTLAAAWALSSDKRRFRDAHYEELRNYDPVTDSLYYTLLAVPFAFLFYAWNPITSLECYYGSRRHESYE